MPPRKTSRSQPGKRRPFMRGNMIRFTAFDLILRVLFRSMMRIAFVIEISCMHFDHRTRNPAGFRVPAYLITYLECLFHRLGLYGRIQVSSQISRQCKDSHWQTLLCQNWPDLNEMDYKLLFRLQGRWLRFSCLMVYPCSCNFLSIFSNVSNNSLLVRNTSRMALNNFTIRTFTSIALSLLSTLASITAPCSVNTYGKL